MAWVERNGKYWRVRYERDDGTIASLSDRYNKTTAQNLADDMNTDRRRGVWIDPERGQIKLTDFAVAWFDAHDVGPAAAAQEHSIWRTHIRPAWGETSMADLYVSYLELAGWLARLSKIRPTTADRARKILRMMLDDAVRDRRIPANPLASLPRSRGRRTPTRDERVWASPTEALAVAQHAHWLVGHWAYTLILTLAWSGARWGEVVGLRPADVDPDRGVIHFREALHEVEGRLWFGEGKTGARDVQVPAFLVAELRPHLDGPLVFTGNRGGMLRRSNFAGRILDPATDGRAGKPATRGRAAIPELPAVCPGITPHGFRHGHNTWLISDGIPEVARAERLGWKVSDKIQAIYSHVDAEMRRRILYALQVRWEDAVAEHRKDMLSHLPRRCRVPPKIPLLILRSRG